MIEYFEEEPTEIDKELANKYLADTPIGSDLGAMAISHKIEQDEQNGFNYGDFW